MSNLRSLIHYADKARFTEIVGAASSTEAYWNHGSEYKQIKWFGPIQPFSIVERVGTPAWYGRLQRELSLLSLKSGVVEEALVDISAALVVSQVVLVLMHIKSCVAESLVI
jgi:hypothetical protein